MKYFQNYFADLSDFEEFDPNAFVSGNGASQELCNFVLALSLAYNDYKNYHMIYNMLLESEPESVREKSSSTGEYFGIRYHLTRLHIAFVHELLNLIEDNKRILSDQFFCELIRNIPRKARESWSVIIDAAFPKRSTKKGPNPLARVRNKIIFHYDAKELFSGYKKGFFRDGSISMKACISRGNKLRNIRFYFADLAVQKYLEKRLEVNIKQFFSELEKIMREINMALYHICTMFIQKRGFAWYSPKKCHPAKI